MDVWSAIGAVLVCLLVLGCDRPAAVGAGGGGETDRNKTGNPPASRPTTAAAGPQAPALAPGDGKVGRVDKSEEEWKKLLSPTQYYVLRQKGTERPFTNEFDHHFEKGTYACAACGLELFTSDTKFDSGCGWPAFYAAKAGDRVKLTPDNSHGMRRVEVTCSRCDGHLGHIFDDAPDKPTGQRYCINSVSLKFIPAKEETRK
jgi:peptide-methionine (R)-S-oxide reductase